jgi:hypothetical protein
MTGKHKECRFPTLEELANLYDETKKNLNRHGRDPKCQLTLDGKNSYGAAYWYCVSNYPEIFFTV